MSTIHLFHGTSYNKYLSIKNSGFSDCKKTIWDCSIEEKTYFYEMERMSREEGMEDESIEDKIILCLEKANESAQITASLEPHQVRNDRTVVFEILIDEKDLEEHLEEDDSCENTYGAVQIYSLIINNLIKAKKATVIVHFFKFNPKFSLFYLVNLINNRYFEDSWNKLEYEEKEVLRELSKSQCFIESIFDYTEEIKIEQW